MPIYDYKCDGCSHQFEVQHAISEPSPKNCPKCGAAKLRKLLTTGGVLGSTKSGPSGPPPSSPCAGGGCGMGGGFCGI